MAITVSANTLELDSYIDEASGNTPAITFRDQGKPGRGGGTLKQFRFLISGQAVAQDAVVKLGELPRGQILGYSTANSSGVTSLALDLGWQDYTNTAGNAVSGDADGIVDGLSIATANTPVEFNAGTTGTDAIGGLFIDVKGKWDLLATPKGAGITADDDVEIVIFMVTAS